jgi:hypothetical protein
MQAITPTMMGCTRPDGVNEMFPLASLETMLYCACA